MEEELTSEGNAVKNRDLLESIAALLGARAKVDFVHVEAHTGESELNEEAD